MTSETQKHALLLLLDSMNLAAVEMAKSAIRADADTLKIATDNYYDKYKAVLEEICT